MLNKQVNQLYHVVDVCQVDNFGKKKERMKDYETKKDEKKALALALTGVIAAVGGFSNCANAAVIEKSAWSVYYNSPGSNFTTDIAPITAKWGSSYTAKCSRYSGSISVSFSNAYISAASTSFSSTGSKKFTFANSASGTTQNIVFSINNVGKNIGSASGNVAIN